MWCDPRAFCERLKEARKEDVERGHKSPKFEVCVVAAAANEARRALLRDARALDGSRDDVFEEMAMLEGAFAQTLSDL